jgi:glycosyltransferase involved in cell wall biosynthesis
VESFLETVTVPFTYLVVDNHSTDGTRRWLKKEGHPLMALRKNHYPGYACNIGWSQAPRDATHLQRADNDMAFLPGWCKEVEHVFGARRVGQVGLRTRAEEFGCAINTGGNSVILKVLFDKGLRYDERPWPEYPAGLSEDSYFSPAIRKMGYQWKRVRRPCLLSLADGDWEDPYYAKSYGDRRIKRPRGIRYGVR